MQAIHNPSAELRQEIEMDVEAFLKRGGNINKVPVIPAPVKKSKFVIISSRNEFKEASRKKRKAAANWLMFATAPISAFTMFTRAKPD